MPYSYQDFIDQSQTGVVTRTAGVGYPMARVIPGDFYVYQDKALRVVSTDGATTRTCYPKEQADVQRAFANDQVEVAVYRILATQRMFRRDHLIYAPKGRPSETP